MSMGEVVPRHLVCVLLALGVGSGPWATESAQFARSMITNVEWCRVYLLMEVIWFVSRTEAAEQRGRQGKEIHTWTSFPLGFSSPSSPVPISYLSTTYLSSVKFHCTAYPTTTGSWLLCKQ